MWRNRSLIFPAITFLLLAIGATLAVGYTINFAILEDVLQERMVRQAQQVSRDVLLALEHKVERLERFKNSWMANATWSREAENDPRLVDKQQEETPDLMWHQLSTLFPLWGVDFILLLDPSGHVTHRMPADFGGKEPLSSELIKRTLSQTSDERAVWHVAQAANAWQIMLFAPIKIAPGDGFHRVVFGQGLNKVITQLLHENPDRPFFIAATDGTTAGATTAWTEAPFQPDIARAIIRENKPRMMFDSSLPINLYYTPIAFLDQTFSLVVPVALDEVRQVLTNSRQRLFGSMIFIILLMVGLGMAMERILLRPLRNLRQKAAIMVRACSREEQALYLNPEEQGNEIVMLERAMEEASIKLYAHVAHLVDTKHLLEGLALKDPITSLGNRRMLDEFLGLTLGSCKRKQRQVAVILLVMDTLEKHPGRLTIDEHNVLLRELAARLCKQLRGEDLAFRVQHNEFVAFAPECGDEEQVLSLVYRLHRSLTKPYQLSETRSINSAVHMGVAVFPGAGEQEQTLLANARAALETARQGGRYPFSIYNYPHATQENEADDEE
ncbi:MAG: GGDEF domain-containing protein [Magnetococcus sp. YQC-5]